jgi:hypothetical protein
MDGDFSPLPAAGDDRQDCRACICDPHIVLQLGHVLFRRRVFGEVPRQHELGLEHRPTGVHPSVQRRRHPFVDGMRDPLLHVLDGVAGVTLIPAAVEVLGHGTELDDQVVGKILRSDLTALLLPQPQQGGLVITHDDPCIRSADRMAAIH